MTDTNTTKNPSTDTDTAHPPALDDLSFLYTTTAGEGDNIVTFKEQDFFKFRQELEASAARRGVWKGAGITLATVAVVGAALWAIPKMVGGGGGDTSPAEV
jgi:hypothetical protein